MNIDDLYIFPTLELGNYVELQNRALHKIIRHSAERWAKFTLGRVFNF